MHRGDAHESYCQLTKFCSKLGEKACYLRILRDTCCFEQFGSPCEVYLIGKGFESKSAKRSGRILDLLVFFEFAPKSNLNFLIKSHVLN